MQKILEELKLNLGFHFSDILNVPFVKPYWVFISLTHRCNFNCQMCGVRNESREQELDLGTLKKILDEIAGWKSDCAILFTGGEPFLRKDIFEIIDYAVSLGLRAELVNNGSLINNPDIAAKIISSGLHNIAISLDGANPQTHDSIRRAEGAHSMALDALHYLCQAKRLKNSGPQISVWTTIMKENVEELYEIIFLVEDLGIECLVYHPVIVAQADMQNTIKGGQFWIRDSQIEILKQQIDKIVSYQREKELVAFLHDPYLWLKYFQGTVSKQEWKCNPFMFIDIGPDGYVRSCGAAFGNIKDISLTDCLNTKEAETARERMKACHKPCLQTCWGRPEADSLTGIIQNFLSQVSATDAAGADKKKIIKEAILLLDKYRGFAIQSYKKHGK